MCGESEIEYNDTLRCICENGYTNVNDKCHQIKSKYEDFEDVTVRYYFTEFGDPCMTEQECTLVLNRSYKCRNSRCQCDVGLSLKNGYCTSAGSIILGGFLVWLAILVRLGL